MNWEEKELMIIGEKIGKIRRGRKISQRQLAEYAGISDVTLSRIENGATCMNVLTLVKIAKGLSVPEGEILSSEDEKIK